MREPVRIPKKWMLKFRISFFNYKKDNFFLKKFMREFVRLVPPGCTVYQNSTNLTSHLNQFCQCAVQYMISWYKWLVEILDPVLEFYSSSCVPGSFRFASMIRFLRCANTEFLVSSDICSLFINIPFDEIISICADYLYRSHLKAPPFPENIFIELMELATKSVCFRFNNMMSRQVDGIFLWSPQGSLTANVFVGFLFVCLFVWVLWYINLWSYLMPNLFLYK